MHIRKNVARSISLLCVLMLLVTATIPVQAVVSGTLSNSGIGLSSEETNGTKSYTTNVADVEATWEASDNTIVATVTPGATSVTMNGTVRYYPDKSAKSVLTLTNNLGAEGDEAVLSFSYSNATNSGSIAFSENAVIDGNNVTATLAYGDSVQIIITTSGSTSGSASDNRATYAASTTISNLELLPVNAGIEITLKTVVGGSYTVSDGNETKGMGEVFSNPMETTYTLTAAEPEGNYHFSGWAFNGVEYSDSSMTLTGITFSADTVVEALYTEDPMYAITTASGNAYVDDLVGINSRYLHQSRNEKVDTKTSSNGSAPYYTVTDTSASGMFDTQFVPSQVWAQSGSTITFSTSGKATGEYEGSFARSWVYANMVSDVIRIYAKQDCIFSFDYSNTLLGGTTTPGVHVYVSTSGSETIANILSKGTTYSETSGNVSQTVAAGKYLYIYTNGYFQDSGIKYKGYQTLNYSYSATISNVAVAPNDTRYIQSTTFKDNAGNALGSGKLAVSGTNYTVGSDGVVPIPSMPEGQSMQLSVATVPTNYRLLGWEVDGVMHYTPTYTYDLKANTTINPIFVPNQVTYNATTGAYQYKNISGTMVALDGQYVARNTDYTAFYTSLVDAFNGEGEVVLLGNMTIDGSIVIPTNETLVVPCAMVDIIATDDAGNYIPIINKGGSGAYATLTVNGAVTVNGTLLISGQQSSSNGAPAGSYGQMTVSSGASVTVSGSLYGYGLVKGAGTILAKNGSDIHELCEIRDLPHPAITEMLNQKAGSYQTMPFNSFYINTIEAKTTYESGATLKGHLSIHYDYVSQDSFPAIAAENAILLVKDGTVTKYFDSAAKQIVFRVDEGAAVETGSFTATLKASLAGYERTATLVSSNFFLPISAGYQFVVAGNLDINHDYKMLPGSYVNVLEEGVLTVGEDADLVFYRLNDYDYRRNSSTNTEGLGFSAAGYPVSMSRYSISRASIGSAKLNVDGTVVVNGGLYVTEQPIEAYQWVRESEDEADQSFKNYTVYANGYNFLTGSGKIDVSAANNSVTEIYENKNNNQSKSPEVTTVAVKPIKGLKEDATADAADQYVSLTGVMKGSTNENGLNVWVADPCADGHTEEINAAVAATCTETGLTEGKYCSVCYEILTAQTVVPALGHTPGAEATCSTAQTCTGCGTELQAASGVHSYTVEHEKVEATCGSDGYVVNKCATCDTTERTTQSATGNHTYTDVVTQPTCTEQGYTTHTCSVCGNNYKDTYVEASGHECIYETDAEGHIETCKKCTYAAEKSGHNYGEWTTETEASCTVAGSKYQLCETCNYKNTATIEATGHSYTEEKVSYEWSADWTECTATFTCEVCGEREQETVSSTEGDTQAPTCAEAGSTAYDAVFAKKDKNGNPFKASGSKPIAATGCAWGDWTQVTAPGCESEGKETRTCATCGATEEQAIPATGIHDYTGDWTYTDDGHAKLCVNGCGEANPDAGEHTWSGNCDTTCDSGCGYERTITHDYSIQDEEISAATCSQYAVYKAKCSCGAVSDTETLSGSTYDEDNHNMVAGQTVTPTCTSSGYTVYNCSYGCSTTENRDIVAATGHSMGGWEQTTAPTCTEKGEERRDCASCDHYETQEVAANGHTEEVLSGYAATCTADGLTDGAKCSVCGETLTAQETIPALGHSYTTVVTAPTCTEKGYTTYTCSTCGDNYTANEVDALDHSWDNACDTSCNRGCGATRDPQHSHTSDVTDPTCTEAGYTTFTCSLCGDTFTEPGASATGHTGADAVRENENAATCTEPGSYESVVYCTVCKAEVSRETVSVSAIGHTPKAAVEENVKQGSCTANGSYDEVVYCSVCNAEISRQTKTVEATGHTESEPVVENNVAATCGAAGSYDSVVYCSVCDTELSRETVAVDATGEHTAGETVVENKTDTTCFAAGSYDNVVYCSTCNAELSRNTIRVDKLPHTPAEAVKENEVAATCSEAGSYDSVVYCSVCAEEISRETVVVPATGAHVYATESDRKDATCTEDGYVIKACACGATETTTLTATGHTEVEIPAVEATCTTAGATVGVKCSVCGEIITAQTAVDAKGHAYDDGEVTKAATCSEEGVKTFTCSVCGDTNTEAIAKEEHTPGETVVENEVASTTTKVGSYDVVVYCTACGGETSRETKAALLNPFFCTMALDNSLALNFIINTTTLEGDGHYLVLTRTYSDGTTDEVFTIPQSEWTKRQNANEYLMFSYTDLAAKQMTEDFYLVLYNSKDEQVSIVREDSIQAYAMRGIAALENVPSRLKEARMYVDMLNYGAAAQDAFNYNEGDLANALLTDSQKALATSEVTLANKQEKGTGYGVTTLELESSLKMNLQFSKSVVTRDMYAVVEYTDHYGNAVEKTIQGSEFREYQNNRIGVHLTDLVVADGDTMVTCRVYDANGEQVTYVIESINSYLTRAVNGGGGALYEATIRFTNSAYAYFHRND